MQCGTAIHCTFFVHKNKTLALPHSLPRKYGSLAAPLLPPPHPPLLGPSPLNTLYRLLTADCLVDKA